MYIRHYIYGTRFIDQGGPKLTEISCLRIRGVPRPFKIYFWRFIFIFQLCVCVGVCVHECRYLWRPEASDSPYRRLWPISCWCWESKMSPLPEQIHPSLMSHLSSPALAILNVQFCTLSTITAVQLSSPSTNTPHLAKPYFTPLVISLFILL